MSRAAAACNHTPRQIGDRMPALLASAAAFVPRDRGEALFRKWLNRRDAEALSESQLMAMTADAVLLSVDLLLSQPAISGATAFDRLARSRSGAPAVELAAIALLRNARFRLLLLEGVARPREVTLRDVMSGELFRVSGAEFPPLAAGTPLFARVAVLGDGLCCLPGAVTPLDSAAYAIARGHPSAGAPGAASGVRWAEAVYAHVVRHGTLDVPGLNRPADNPDVELELFEAEQATLFQLAAAWAQLEERTPDATLIERTRQTTNLSSIITGLVGAVLSRDAGRDSMSAAFERLLLVQLETVLRRELSASGMLTLDAVGNGLDQAIAGGRAPAEARVLLATLRRRLPGTSGAGRADDPALERLMQRIQGLRAKTVAQGCTEQEALLAAEKVAELLDRYGLSLGELDFRAQQCEGIGIQTERRRAAPIDSCVPAIAAFFDCRVWLEHAKGTALRYVFFGLRSDVAAAQYLYELVERAFETETDAFRAGDLYARMIGDRRSASNSFQIGLARGISDKLHALRSARDATRRSASGRDLVPVKAAMVDDELAKLGLDFRSRQVGRGRRVLADAFREGEAAGQRFEFTPAISNAA
jgi:hypothetical protein